LAAPARGQPGPTTSPAPQPPPPSRFARPPPSVARPGTSPVPRGPPPPPAPTPAVEEGSPTATPDLRAHFGAEIAARLLRSDDPAERLRGIARAASAGTPEAIALLVQTSDPTGP